MEAHHEPVGAAVAHPVVVDVARKRPDIAGVVVEAVDRAQARQPPHPPRVGEHRIERRRRRARRVLGKKRHRENAIATRRPQSAERVRDPRIAVAHRKLDRRKVRRQPLVLEALAEVAHQQRLLLQAVCEQRGPVAAPDHRVFSRRPRRPHPQDHEVQYRLPEEARDFDDAAIGKKFREVAPHGRGGGRVRRAEVEQEDADPARLLVLPLAARRETRSLNRPHACGSAAACPAGEQFAPWTARRRSLIPGSPIAERLRRLGAHRALHRRQPAHQRALHAQRLPEPAPEVEPVDMVRDQPVAKRERRVDAIVDAPPRGRVGVGRDPVRATGGIVSASMSDATTARSLPRAHSMLHIAATPAASRARNTGSENVASGA